MKVTSSINESEIVDKLATFVAESSKLLELKVKELTIGEINKEENGRIILGYEAMTNNYDDGRVCIKTDFSNTGPVPEDILKAMVEHELSHGKDIAVGEYDHRSFIIGPPENNPLFVLAIETDKSYSDYVASKRQIQVFGKDSLEKMQVFMLKEFLEDIDNIFNNSYELVNRLSNKSHDSIMLTPEGPITIKDIKENMINSVFSLFKEYIKCDLIDYRSEAMKEPIVMISNKLMKIFDIIRDTDTHWIDKTKMLFYTSMATYFGYDLITSYGTNQIQKNEESDNNLTLKTLVNKIQLESPHCLKTLEKVDTYLNT